MTKTVPPDRASAGYSGTPLPKKLGIRPDSRVSLVGAPGPLDDVEADAAADGARDVIVWFVTRRSDLASGLVAQGERVRPAGGLWIAWPKRASGVPTDITEDTIREEALPLGLVDNKVCAIDATWSGLRLVWRKSLR